MLHSNMAISSFEIWIILSAELAAKGCWNKAKHLFHHYPLVKASYVDYCRTLSSSDEFYRTLLISTIDPVSTSCSRVKKRSFLLRFQTVIERMVVGGKMWNFPSRKDFYQGSSYTVIWWIFGLFNVKFKTATNFLKVGGKNRRNSEFNWDSSRIQVVLWNNSDWGWDINESRFDIESERESWNKTETRSNTRQE